MEVTYSSSKTDEVLALADFTQWNMLEMKRGYQLFVQTKISTKLALNIFVLKCKIEIVFIFLINPVANRRHTNKSD